MKKIVNPEDMLGKIEKWFDSKKRKVFLLTFLLGFISNILLITNDLLFTDAIAFTEIHFSNNWELSLGRWLLPYVDHLRWGVASAVVSTILALIFLALIVVLIIDLFKIKSKISIFIISLTFAVSPFFSETLFSVFCSAEYTLSCLLATLSIYLVYKCNHKFLSIIIPSLLISFSLGLYQPYIGVATTLCILTPLIMLIKKEEDTKIVFKKMLKSLVVGIIGIILYEIFLNFVLFIWHEQLASYSGANEIGLKNLIMLPQLVLDTFRSFYRYYFNDNIINNIIYRRHIINLIIIVVIIIATLIHFKENKPKLNTIALIVLCVILLPIMMGTVEIIAPERDINSLMDAPYVLLYPFLLALLEFKKEGNIKNSICWAGVILTFYISFSYFVMANATYMAVRIKTNETIDAASKIAQRVETNEEYRPDMPVLFAGNAVNEYFSNNNQVFKYASGLTPKVPMMWGEPEICQRDWHNLINYYLGKDFKMVNYEQYKEILNTEEFKKMETYPKNNSVAVINDVIVVKILDNPSIEN